MKMAANHKTPAMLAEGTAYFDYRAGGDFMIVSFDNGASVMLSRADAATLSRQLRVEVDKEFCRQQATLYALEKPRKGKKVRRG